MTSINTDQQVHSGYATQWTIYHYIILGGGEVSIKWRKYMEMYAFMNIKTRKHDVSM